MREKKFSYEWRRTWPDSANDFTCWEGGFDIGRVRLHNAGSAQFWMWYMGDDRPGRLLSANGRTDTRDDACHALEAAFDMAVAGMEG